MSRSKIIASESSSSESQTDCSPKHQYSAISEHSSVRGTPQAIREWLMSLPEDSRVSRSVSRESKPERTTHGTCGLKPLRQLALLDQSMSFSKMYQGSSTPDPLLAYVGGLIDGEGCISIQKTSGKKKACYYLEIAIGMSLKAAPLLQAIKKSFGGTLCKGRVKSKNWDGSLKWRIGGEKAMEFLVKVQPYIILKASQTSIAIELEMMRQNAPTLPNGTKDWSKIRDSAEQLKQRIHRLNQKGPDVQDAVGRWITPQTNLFGTSDSFSGPWPKHGMMQDGSLWELTMSGLPIAEKGCGLWPTARTRGLLGGSGSREMVQQMVKNGNISESEAVAMLGVKMWPTPSICGNYNRKGASATSGDGLDTAVRNWRTPSATEADHGGPNARDSKGGLHLSAQVRQYPTPVASMVSMADMEQARFAVNSPERPKYCNAGEGQLNPDWVCWLMGWPIGWESLEPMKKVLWLDWSVDPADMEKPEMWPTHKSGICGMTAVCSDRPPEKSTHLTMQVHLRGRTGTGPIPRVATGIKDRVNRLKALGNGQVPLCAAAAWEILKSTGQSRDSRNAEALTDCSSARSEP